MKSPLVYVGGKSRLAEKIVGMIPQHKSYVEVFAGAGWVFFRKEPSRFEILNDLDSDLITLYRVLQNHLEEFLKQFKWLLTSREWFEDWNDQIKSKGLTDIQRAARYYYLQRLCFGGKVRDRTFGASPEHSPRINLLRIEEELSAVHLRLAHVTIENVSYEKVLKTYDRADTFFYLDPPYYKAPEYRHNLYYVADYETIAAYLRNLKGKFLLSINDRAEMRYAFQGFPMDPVSLSYSVGVKKGCEGKELLIRNYEV